MSWSPDGERVLLTEYRNFRGRIWEDQWIDILFGELSRLELSRLELSRLDLNRLYIVSIDVSTGNASDVVRGAYASWSPDGSRIAVLGKYDDGGYLATVAPDGSDFRVLVKADEDGDLELADN